MAVSYTHLDVYKRQVKYEVLEPVLDFHKAKDHPILIHPEENWKSLVPVGADNQRNLCAHEECSEGDVDAILAECAYVVDETYHTKANQQAMMETFRAYSYKDTYGRLNIVSATQVLSLIHILWKIQLQVRITMDLLLRIERKHIS